MKNLEKIKCFLEKEEKCFCDDCISLLTLVTPRQQVNAICRKHSDIFYSYKTNLCFYCKKKKITRSVQKLKQNSFD